MQSEQFRNLKVHRSDASVWERRPWRDNYFDDKLGISLALAGACLLLYGAFPTTRRTKASLWWGVSGAGLISCAAARLRGRPSATSGRSSHYRASAPDVVTVESEDSFPASDAPSSNATTVSPQPLRDRH
jgi:hypothetical protein